MSNKIDPVIHFEMPAEDTAGLGKFYETAFGWQLQPLGAQARDFVLAFTGEVDEKTRMPKKRGHINGGFYKKANAAQRIKLTILVDDIQTAIKKSQSGRRQNNRRRTRNARGRTVCRLRGSRGQPDHPQPRFYR